LPSRVTRSSRSPRAMSVPSSAGAPSTLRTKKRLTVICPLSSRVPVSHTSAPLSRPTVRACAPTSVTARPPAAGRRMTCESNDVPTTATIPRTESAAELGTIVESPELDRDGSIRVVRALSVVRVLSDVDGERRLIAPSAPPFLEVTAAVFELTAALPPPPPRGRPTAVPLALPCPMLVSIGGSAARGTCTWVLSELADTVSDLVSARLQHIRSSAAGSARARLFTVLSRQCEQGAYRSLHPDTCNCQFAKELSARAVSSVADDDGASPARRHR
jgi:hypothetical protein